MVYKARVGSRLRGDAQKIGEELESIRVSNGGMLLPAHVVDRARDDDSPLHEEFEWDDETAAEEYRKAQARTVIRSVVTLSPVDDDDIRKTPVAAFVHLRVKTIDEEGKEGAKASVYLSVRDVVNNEDLRSQMMLDARRELHAFEKKYAELKELDDELAMVLDVIGSISE